MVLTSQRLLFEPVATRLQALLWWPLIPIRGILSGGYPPAPFLVDPVSFELAEIERFWKWTPEFSGPPMFTIGRDGWRFRLIKGLHRSVPAEIEVVRDHFYAVEAAWLKAREAMSNARPSLEAPLGDPVRDF
jgi:hypothetical protein